MLSIVIFLSLSLSFSQTAYAVSSDFIVRTLIGADTTAPSVPSPFTATPVATSQIDLAWGTSTDDYLLSGYQVFRDDVQIATTTSTVYSDVGLSASTTYAYYVTAYDFFNNISASSTVVATTTLAIIIPPTPTTTVSDGTRYGSLSRLGGLISLEIVPSQTGAVIRYQTEGYVRTVTGWGTTISYELGSSAERAFSKSHETIIEDLVPGTLYRLIIKGENHLGVMGVLTETSFRTLPLDDTFPPGNILHFKAVQRGDDVVLTWENPHDSDFNHVRILRSDRFYPSDTADGWVVYEGIGDTVTDSDVLLPGTRLYYTAFTYDHEGNISSGAVVTISLDGDTPMIDETINDINLTFNEIEFYQENKKIPNAEGVFIKGGSYLTIAIPYERLPEHLKTILVSIVPESDPRKTLDFLLRVNAEKTYYTARLSPLGVAGNFGITVTVFDFKTRQIGYTKGKITSVISTYNDDDENSGIAFIEYTNIEKISYVIVFTLLLMLLAIMSRRLMHARW